jgi:hypothetical protein
MVSCFGVGNEHKSSTVKATVGHKVFASRGCESAFIVIASFRTRALCAETCQPACIKVNRRSNEQAAKTFCVIKPLRSRHAVLLTAGTWTRMCVPSIAPTQSLKYGIYLVLFLISCGRGVSAVGCMIICEWRRTRVLRI